MNNKGNIPKATKQETWTEKEVQQILQAVKDSFVSPVVHREFVDLVKQMYGIELK